MSKPANSASPGASAQLSQAGNVQGSGMVNAIGPAGHKINLDHNAIPSIGWPAMTMEFTVAPSVELRAILILQPQIELNFYTKHDPARRIGAGLSELDAGLRLRYEIARQFAPYVGVTYLGQYGATADYVSAAGGSTQQLGFTAGVRTWF